MDVVRNELNQTKHIRDEPKRNEMKRNGTNAHNVTIIYKMREKSFIFAFLKGKNSFSIKLQRRNECNKTEEYYMMK